MYIFCYFPQVIGAKVINVTVTITNKECKKDDQSFWQSLKEAVICNTLFNFIYLYYLCVQVIPVCVQSTLL